MSLVQVIKRGNNQKDRIITRTTGAVTLEYANLQNIVARISLIIKIYINVGYASMRI